MDVNKEYIKTAIKEFEQIENALNGLQGEKFSFVCMAMAERFFGNVHNYDGELFDIELSRVLCTVNKGKKNTATLDRGLMFDVSENLCGEWIDTNIEELKKAVEL